MQNNIYKANLSSFSPYSKRFTKFLNDFPSLGEFGVRQLVF